MFCGTLVGKHTALTDSASKFLSAASFNAEVKKTLSFMSVLLSPLDFWTRILNETHTNTIYFWPVLPLQIISASCEWELLLQMVRIHVNTSFLHQKLRPLKNLYTV